MDGVAAVIRKVGAGIYSGVAQSRHLSRNDLKIRLESGKGVGRRTVLKDPAGNLIGPGGVESSLKAIQETGVFPTILEKASAPQEVIDLYAARESNPNLLEGGKSFSHVWTETTQKLKGIWSQGRLLLKFILRCWKRRHLGVHAPTFRRYHKDAT